MNEREKFFISFFLKSFLIIFLSFPPFSISSPSLFLLFNPNQNLLSLLLLLLNHLAVCITFFLFVIFFFLLFSLCLVLFNAFSHSSLQTILFHSFEILFRYNIVLFSVLPLLILRFPFLKVVIGFFSTCRHSHREIRTNMHHDKGTKRNANALSFC